MNNAFFFMTQERTNLVRLQWELYGRGKNRGKDDKTEANDEMAQMFYDANIRITDNSCEIWPGQMLYLPQRENNPKLHEIKDLLKATHKMHSRLNPDEQQQLAYNYNLIDISLQAGRGGVAFVNSMYGQSLSQLQYSLRMLENEFILEMKTHGKLTSRFYEKRARIYKDIQAASRGFIREQVFGSSDVHDSVKRVLGIKWRQEVKNFNLFSGEGNPPYRIEVFEKHYANAAKASKIPKRVGTGLTVIDLGIRADTIYDACTAEPGSDANCTKTVYEQSAGFGLSMAGAKAGAWAGAAACAPLAPTVIGGAGCVIVLGAAGALLGGWLGGEVGESLGRNLYDGIHT